MSGYKAMRKALFTAVVSVRPSAVRAGQWVAVTRIAGRVEAGGGRSAEAALRNLLAIIPTHYEIIVNTVAA